MTSRDRLKQVLAGRKGVAPPRYESEFAPEVVTAWRKQGAIGEEPPESALGLDAMARRVIEE